MTLLEVSHSTSPGDYFLAWLRSPGVKFSSWSTYPEPIVCLLLNPTLQRCRTIELKGCTAPLKICNSFCVQQCAKSFSSSLVLVSSSESNPARNPLYSSVRAAESRMFLRPRGGLPGRAGETPAEIWKWKEIWSWMWNPPELPSSLTFMGILSFSSSLLIAPTHRSGTGPRFDFNYQPKFHQNMILQCPGNHITQERKKSTEGPSLRIFGFCILLVNGGMRSYSFSLRPMVRLWF